MRKSLKTSHLVLALAIVPVSGLVPGNMAGINHFRPAVIFGHDTASTTGSPTGSTTASTPTAAGAVAAAEASRNESNPDLESDTVISTIPPLKVPFKVGEEARYEVKFGFLKVGSATMQIPRIEKVRGIDAWHSSFRIEGGTIGFRVKNIIESWIDTASFTSLRFHQTLDEGPRDRIRKYEIYPDKRTYVEMEKDPPRTHKSVSHPLDDGSFLQFIRSVPLVVGKTYRFNNYFRPDRNPVTIRVLRHERVKVPAGTYNTIVIQPIIKTSGIFSENGQAEVWISDDDRRIVVQLKSKLSFGSINLYLTSFKPGK